MFENKFNRPKPVIQKKEGCKIKVRYDKNGKVRELEDNGQCSAKDRENFLQNLNGQPDDD